MSTESSDARCSTFGFILIIGSMIIQFITEHNYITKLRDINTIQSNVIDLNQPSASIAPSHPVYITDTFHLSSNSRAPIDHDTGVTYNTFVIHKDIEMYQWNEKKTLAMASGHTKYYVKEWSSKYINHEQFKHPQHHHNPHMAQDVTYFWSTNIMLGKYHISQSILTNNVHRDDGSDWKDITDTVYQTLCIRQSQCRMKDGYVYLTNDNEDEPNIGDMRAKWSALDLDGTSGTFLGRIEESNELRGYVSDNKNEFVYLKIGESASIQDIIASFHSDNTGHLKVFRGLTLVFMCIGFMCTSSFVGTTGYWAVASALTVASPLWMMFFAIAYLSPSKEVGFGLIVVVSLALLILHKRAGTNAAKQSKTD
eukprot:238744_1